MKSSIYSVLGLILSFSLSTGFVYASQLSRDESKGIMPASIGSLQPAKLVEVKQSSSMPITRGDPKTDFDQKENEGHSNKPIKDVPLIQNFSGWQLAGAGGSATAYQVTYLSPTNGTKDQVVVTYNLLTGDIINVMRQIVTVAIKVPDLKGLTSIDKFVRPNGVRTEVYANKDMTKTVILNYDKAGNLIQATTTTQEQIKLNKVIVPSYHSRWGWTKGSRSLIV